MNQQKFLFWQKWLTWANVLTVIVGVLVAFAGDTFIFDIHNSYTTDIYFDGQEIEGDLLMFKKWMFGIIGGTIVGFHLLMIMISEHAFKQKEKWAYKAMWLGMLSWFCIDSGLSLYYGALHNIIIINLLAMILIGLPLLMTRKAFTSD